MPSLGLGQWYVVRTKSRREEVAQFHLQRKGLTVFFPRLLVPQSNSRRIHIVPLFPGYLFVQVQKSTEYDWVRWVPGVKDVVNFNGIPVPVDEEIVMFLRTQATPAGVLTEGSLLIIKHKAEGLNEPFTRLVNGFQRLYNSRTRVKVLLQLFEH